MKTTMLMTLLGLVTVAESAVGSPPATELPAKNRFDKPESTDTDELRVNVIGREIQIHRADPGTSASKLHAQQRNSVTALTSNARFTRSLAIVHAKNSLTAAAVPSQLKRAPAVDSSDLPPTNHASNFSIVIVAGRGSSALKQFAIAEGAPTVTSGPTVRKKLIGQ
jgi:hypothetical protein